MAAFQPGDRLPGAAAPVRPRAGASPGTRAAAAALLLWALVLHALFFGSAGALWRDEANSAAQAQLPSWRALRESLHYDSFPILYPALLRAWSGAGPGASDRTLRFLGLLTGLALAGSVWAAGRVLGSRRPVVATLLVSAGPLIVAEADSVRPYGIGLLFLVWTCAALGRCAAGATAGWLATAAACAVLCVQAGYTNAVPIGVLTLCAAAAARPGAGRRARWALFLPGAAAALSLAPYYPALRTAAGWAGIVRQPVDWAAFSGRFLDGRSLVFAAVWAAACTLAAAAVLGHGGAPRRLGPRAATDLYCRLVAAAVLPAQLGLIWLQGVPPFPRYFLPALVPLALAVDVLGRASRWRVPFALLGALLTAVPSWSALDLRRTNADAAAALLTAQAAPQDLVVLSPWFLHPSFQRYYRGRAEWVMAPVLERAPVMRYDLVKKAMLGGPGDEPAAAIAAALRRGGAVWLVTQRRFRSTPGGDEARPEPHAPPDGRDYVRFRGYWERGVEQALARCCADAEHPLAPGPPVWEEEDLVVVRWAARRP